jgi:hypothetical protein
VQKSYMADNHIVYSMAKPARTPARAIAGPWVIMGAAPALDVDEVAPAEPGGIPVSKGAIKRWNSKREREDNGRAHGKTL